LLLWLAVAYIGSSCSGQAVVLLPLSIAFSSASSAGRHRNRYFLGSERLTRLMNPLLLPPLLLP